jgi:hypothetical protein
MAIFSDLELQHVMNEGSKEKKFEGTDNIKDLVNDTINDVKSQAKDRGKQIEKSVKSGLKKSYPGKKGKITFKEDANGNIIDCEYTEPEYIEEKTINGWEKVGTISYTDKAGRKIYTTEKGAKQMPHVDGIYVGKEGLATARANAKTEKDIEKKLDNMRRDLTVKGAVEAKKQEQEWKEKPAEKTLTTAADIATGGGLIRRGANLLGKELDKGTRDIVKKQEEKRKAKHEAVDWRDIPRSPEYTRAMNEFFDITDRETRKVLLAVNEADQNKVLVSLTSKLYDNVVDRIDDIDFGEIERTKGDIEKLPNFETLHECLNNMARLLIEFKQDTKPVDTIAESVANIIESKPIWTKAYAINAELPMITYNTITLAIIEATSYMVSMCVEFVKSPSQDTIQVMIDKSALTKSKGHMLFKNLESFNEAYNKGQVTKAMEGVIAEVASKKSIAVDKKAFLGFYMGGAAAVASVIGLAGLLFCIIPIIRELIFLFFYYRVRISEFFDVQADLLQVNAYNVQNNRLDLTAQERKNISNKQMKVADDFRKISKKIAVDGAQAEKSASKDIKYEDSKKYKAEEIMDELPDSAASSSSLF